jgi:hypothetical protein
VLTRDIVRFWKLCFACQMNFTFIYCASCVSRMYFRYEGRRVH